MFKRKSGKSKMVKAARPAVAIKKSTDVYTVMLIISFVEVAIAALLLFLEGSRYGSFPWWNVP